MTVRLDPDTGLRPCWHRAEWGLSEKLKQQENAMHYKNGREAKNGDKVMLIPAYGPPVIGILYDATAGNDFCNGRIAPIKPTDPQPNLKEVLHLDDVLAALPKDDPPAAG